MSIRIIGALAAAGLVSAGSSSLLAQSANIDPSAASIFTAVQEQLGLKLDSTRGMVEVLAIDTLARPTPN